jgi:hypothetical protein
MKTFPANSPTHVTVIKLDASGRETWRYPGRVIQRQANWIVIEAFFDRPDMLLHGMPLLRGDRFLETYFGDRWYNIFEIHDRRDDQLRGWYCNITRPASIAENTIRYIDLALDLLVFPDGRQLVLDEDQFEKLNLSQASREQARLALDKLKRDFQQKLQM